MGGVADESKVGWVEISDWDIENNTSLTGIDIRRVVVSCIVDREVSIVDESRQAGSKLRLVVFRTWGITHAWPSATAPRNKLQKMYLYSS